MTLLLSLCRDPGPPGRPAVPGTSRRSGDQPAPTLLCGSPRRLCPPLCSRPQHPGHPRTSLVPHGLPPPRSSSRQPRGVLLRVPHESQGLTCPELLRGVQGGAGRWREGPWRTLRAQGCVIHAHPQTACHRGRLSHEGAAVCPPPPPAGLLRLPGGAGGPEAFCGLCPPGSNRASLYPRSTLSTYSLTEASSRESRLLAPTPRPDPLRTDLLGFPHS